ncbi:MAG: hypothetical protein E6J79_13355 [Deltaproteobacteria bacterium]|nr:MAG: hypothetical protein E6J79_13355 [Deltaproteobacteria bacterium]
MRRPVQVYLDDADLTRLERWVQERGWTKSRAIRLAVRALTRPTTDDPILELSGMFDGLPPDLSEHFDHYLKETYVAEHEPTYRSRRARAKSRLRR